MVKMLIFDYRDSEREYFKNHDTSDFEITFYEGSLDEDTILKESEKNETVIISVFINSKITEKVLSQFKNLLIISTRSTGYDHIDIESCRKRNVSVLNVSDYGRGSVAQFTIGIILSMVRNIIPAVNDVKNRDVSHKKYEGLDISKLTLGVIGTGSIGSAVCELADVFGMEILAYDFKINKDIKEFVEYVPFNDILRKSDIITIHIPYMKEVHHMFSTKEFEKMKNNSYLINTSRGELIDTKALYEAVKSKKLKGVALDVTECEQLNSNIGDFDKALKTSDCSCFESGIITQKLMSYDNVIITPHIAYHTRESVNTILDTMFNNIKSHFKGEHTNQVV